MVMNEIEVTASRLGVDLSIIDLDSIRLPSGNDFGIVRYSTPPLLLSYKFLVGY